ncbi:hypothetical protein [Paractinoplanes brasiliensis]|nr:hypothetical protein [Actinoplanes brasiliensis]
MAVDDELYDRELDCADGPAAFEAVHGLAAELRAPQRPEPGV